MREQASETAAEKEQQLRKNLSQERSKNKGRPDYRKMPQKLLLKTNNCSGREEKEIDPGEK